MPSKIEKSRSGTKKRRINTTKNHMYTEFLMFFLKPTQWPIGPIHCPMAFFVSLPGWQPTVRPMVTVSSCLSHLSRPSATRHLPVEVQDSEDSRLFLRALV